MDKLNFIVTSTFGLEASVKRELNKLGYENLSVIDGHIKFSGDLETIPKCNLWLRSADRLFLNIGEFFAYSFDELFEKTKMLPWENWIPENGKFTITGKSVKSKLFSVSDCQSIVKKAIVERLKIKYKKDWFEETGPEYKIKVSLLKDNVTLTIDTSGLGLHKRGYREQSVIAPIKETLASALIELSYFKKNRTFVDPACGSGTLPIEAALLAKNIAPGLTRNFISESWPQIPKNLWKNARAQAYDLIDNSFTPDIYGYDVDPKAIEISKHNAMIAGVDDCIKFNVKDINNLTLDKEYGILICNPPYGQRLTSDDNFAEFYKTMGKLLKENKTWSFYAITSNENFERYFGKKADKKRKLFNGALKTNYYQYIGPRPLKDFYK